MDIHPLLFKPILKPRIWGGQTLGRLFGKPLGEGETIGESWEVADLPEGKSVVAVGPEQGAGLDELVRQNMYPSRSAAIRAAVRDLLRRELWTR